MNDYNPPAPVDATCGICGQVFQYTPIDEQDAMLHRPRCNGCIRAIDQLETQFDSGDPWANWSDPSLYPDRGEAGDGNLGVARQMASELLGYVQAQQADPRLYSMALDLYRELEALRRRDLFGQKGQ